MRNVRVAAIACVISMIVLSTVHKTVVDVIALVALFGSAGGIAITVLRRYPARRLTFVIATVTTAAALVALILLWH